MWAAAEWTAPADNRTETGEWPRTACLPPQDGRTMTAHAQGIAALFRGTFDAA
jgi:hypothetical protein